MPHIVGACALDCPDACSWVVTVRDGVAVRLRGNADHPFTRGGLCTKVAPFLEYAASPQRLRTPMRRTGPKGTGAFVPITWDEALTEIAQRIRQAVDTDGGESVWPFAGTGTLGYLQGCESGGTRLFHALGASRHRLDICASAGHAGMRYTTGSAMGMDPTDLERSALILLWGTNTLTTNLHLWPFVTAGRRSGAEVVVIDPVRTRTAERADRHLAPRPGTDAALALGVMAELVRLGATDEEYLASRTLGWAPFRDTELAAWNAGRAAEICGLPVDDVRWLAGRIAACRPTGIRALMGMQRHGGGGAAMRVLSCLPAVTGDYGRLGGGLCYSTGPAYGVDTAAISRPDLQPAGPTRRLEMSSLGRELLERTDPPVRVLFMWAANPMVSNPDTGRTRAGLSRDDLFTVVVDHVLTDTARYADVVLPGTTQLEHADLHNSYSHLYLQWNAPAVEPPPDCLPHTEIFRRLARRLGLTHPALFATDDELAEDALGGGHPSVDGITLAALKERGWARLAVPDPFLPFADGFPTPSGRFEFRSDRAEADGAGALPGYRAPHVAAGRTHRRGRPREAPAVTGTEPGAGTDEGLELLSPAQHHLLNSQFAHGPRAAAAGRPHVVLHPSDAADCGVTDGARVVVSNAVGAFTAVAVLSDAVRVGVAVAPKGFWPVEEAGRAVTRRRPGHPSDVGDAGHVEDARQIEDARHVEDARQVGDGVLFGGVNAVTADRPSDLGDGATFHDTRVRVRPIGRSAAGADTQRAEGSPRRNS